MGVIYGLADMGGKIRYVGKTIGKAEHRLTVHLRHARSGADAHVYRWLRSINCEPVLVILEEASASLNDAEVRWIAELRARGNDLTNCTPGGDGGPTRLGMKNSEEHRASCSAALKGKKRSPEAIEKVRRHFAGRPLSEEHKAKLRGKTFKHTEEAKRKIAEAKRGKPLSEEHRAAMSASLKGRPSHSPKCEPGCTCGRHKPRETSEETRARMSDGQRRRQLREKGIG